MDDRSYILGPITLCTYPGTCYNMKFLGMAIGLKVQGLNSTIFGKYLNIEKYAIMWKN